MSAAADTSDASGHAPTQPTPQSALQAALDDAQKSTDALKAIRANADLTSKTLAGIGTFAATALGVAKIAGVFPQPPGARAAVLVGFAVMIVGLVAALAAVLWLASRLWKVSDAIPSSSDVEEMKKIAGLKHDEERIVKRVYEEKAEAEEVASLRAYEARGRRFERVALRMQADDQQLTQGAQAMLARSLIVEAEVAAVQARATYLVGRKRAARAFTDRYAAVIGVLFVSGLIMASFGDSYLAARTNAQTARVALAKSCADATKAARDATIAPRPTLQIIDVQDCAGVLPQALPPTTTTSAATPK